MLIALWWSGGLKSRVPRVADGIPVPDLDGACAYLRRRWRDRATDKACLLVVDVELGHITVMIEMDENGVPVVRPIDREGK